MNDIYRFSFSWFGLVFIQTSVCLGIGIGLSCWLKRRPSRGHLALLLALVLGLLCPLASHLAQMQGWGVLPPGWHVFDFQYSDGAPAFASEWGGAPLSLLASSLVSSSSPGGLAGGSIVLGIWLAGCCIALTRLLLKAVADRRLLTSGRIWRNSVVERRLAAAGSRISVRRTPAIWLCPAIASPAIYCWSFPPRILVPAHFACSSRGGNSVDWESVFIHELAHLQRRDHVTSLLAELTTCVLWWQPLAWWAKSRLRRCSEEACDAWALSNGPTPERYAETLFAMSSHQRFMTLFSMSGERRHMKRRFQFILGYRCAKPHVGATWSILAIVVSLAIMCAIVAMNPASPLGQESPRALPNNLLLNAGFELGKDEPERWKIRRPIEGVKFLWDRETAHSGKSSLVLRKSLDRYFPIAQWTQTIALPADLGAGRNLEASAWVRAERAYKAIVDVQFIDSDGEWSHRWASYIGARNAGDPPADHDWRKYSGIVEIPEGTIQIHIALQIYGPGTVWFDDVIARRVPSEPADD